MKKSYKRRVQQCCIAIMDLDHFKAVNDACGHRAGDQVLSVSVRYVMENVRPYDKVFRYGGEAFLLALPSTDLRAGQMMIERIREGLGITALAHHNLKPILVTASFELALLDPDVSVEEAIHRVDQALYAAKTAGRNCVRIWDIDNAVDAVGG
jgi:diguanylate cyclase (GGDEF)-like protein